MKKKKQEIDGTARRKGRAPLTVTAPEREKREAGIRVNQSISQPVNEASQDAELLSPACEVVAFGRARTATRIITTTHVFCRWEPQNSPPRKPL